MITGQVLSIDEGDQAARIVIGLGMGRSKVEALVQVYEVLPEGPVLVQQYLGDSRSGFKPGMAESLAVGAVAATVAGAAMTSSALAVGSEAFLANLDADADRMGRKLADAIRALHKSRWDGRR
jgi:hypothetical protein